MDLDAIEQRHQRSWRYSTNDVCSWCHDLWPCDAAELAKRVRSLTEALRQANVELEGTVQDG